MKREERWGETAFQKEADVVLKRFYEQDSDIVEYAFAEGETVKRLAWCGLVDNLHECRPGDDGSWIRLTPKGRAFLMSGGFAELRRRKWAENLEKGIDLLSRFVP